MNCPKCGASEIGTHEFSCGSSRCCPSGRFEQSTYCMFKEMQGRLDDANEEIERLTKIVGVVRAYCDAPGQLRGDAYRDLAGTLDWIDGKPELYGWPAICNRLTDERDKLRAERDALLAENQQLKALPQIVGDGVRTCHETGERY